MKTTIMKHCLIVCLYNGCGASSDTMASVVRSLKLNPVAGKERVAPPLNPCRILNVLTSVKIGTTESAEMKIYLLACLMLTIGLIATVRIKKN